MPRKTRLSDYDRNPHYWATGQVHTLDPRPRLDRDARTLLGIAEHMNKIDCVGHDLADLIAWHGGADTDTDSRVTDLAIRIRTACDAIGRIAMGAAIEMRLSKVDKSNSERRPYVACMIGANNAS